MYCVNVNVITVNLLAISHFISSILFAAVKVMNSLFMPQINLDRYKSCKTNVLSNRDIYS